jgi:hypothetical protein
MISAAISAAEDIEGWTRDRLIEELYICLMKKCASCNYQSKAYDLMFRIPVHRPTPFFEIKISDLSEQVKKELDDRWSSKLEIDYILKEAVGRVFANVDERYFLLSVKRVLKVRLIS